MINLLIALTLSTGIAHNTSILNEFKLIGTSNLSWAFLDIYDISLYNQTGVYLDKKQPLALVIRYYVNIDQKKLIDSTVNEWKKLPVQWQKQWVKDLALIWPSVSKNDELMLYVDQQNNSHFYLNRKLIGGVSDPEFSDAFLAIWLSPKTSRPDLRKELLGIDNEY